MQTAVPHAMQAAEVGLTSLLATSSAWQGKPDPHTWVSTMHTAGNSTRTHAHAHTIRSHTDVRLPSCYSPNTHAQGAEIQVNVEVLSLCPPRLGEKERALPSDPQHWLPLPCMGLVNTS